MLGAVGRMRAGKTLRTPLAVTQLRFLMVAVLIASLTFVRAAEIASKEAFDAGRDGNRLKARGVIRFVRRERP